MNGAYFLVLYLLMGNHVLHPDETVLFFQQQWTLKVYKFYVPMLLERIEMTRRRGWRRKQLLDDLKEKRRYWKLKEEALDRTLWRTRFGRSYGSVVRQTTEWMNEWMNATGTSLCICLLWRSRNYVCCLLDYINKSKYVTGLFEPVGVQKEVSGILIACGCFWLCSIYVFSCTR
jgi:hypothetical protein